MSAAIIIIVLLGDLLLLGLWLNGRLRTDAGDEQTDEVSSC